MAAARKTAEEKPAEASTNDKTVTLKSPWGSRVTVAAESVDALKDAGFTATK